MDEPNKPSDVRKIELAAAALQTIVTARMQAAKVKKSFKTTWAKATDEELEAASGSHGTVLPQHKVTLKFLYADRLAARAIREVDPLLIKRALREIYFAGVLLTRSPQLPRAAQLAAATMALLIVQQIKMPKASRQQMERVVSEGERRGVRPALTLVLHGLSDKRLQELIHVAGVGAKVAPPVSYPVIDTGPYQSTADLLAQAALRQEAEANNAPVMGADYDLSETDLKLSSIRLSGFRGSPNETIISLTQKKVHASVIIFGENGVGKSTVVDAIEFALQARVSRSLNFDSPLASAVRSFATDPLPEVEAELSDGRKIARTVEMSRAGTLEPAPRDVSAGFRLAPVTLNRADLQRLLDTESLERGTVLLDYFPGDLDRLAMRPKEEVHRLKSEMADLRIRRSSLATQLGTLINEGPHELVARDRFVRVIREKFMNGETFDQFEKRDGWSTVPEEIRVLIARLQGTHSALTAAKNRSERTVEILNPIAHAKQANILASILAQIGAELSEAFGSVCHEYPVDRIDVVFGASGPLSLDFVVRLKNGYNCSPQQIFSEAYKDLIALLFFTSVAKKAAERGQARILILDDVLQSIDAGIRHEFMSYLLSEFADWQLIVTVHDRLWRDQLRALFAASNHKVIEKVIHGWTFLDGPQLAPPDFDELTADLQAMMVSGQPRSIGALAGQLLETICDRVTRKLRLQVHRNDDDRYTLGDLWPPLQQRLVDTPAQGEVRKIAAHKVIRNLTVHPDPQSWNLSLADAQAFASAVLTLYRRLRCPTCNSWVSGGKHPRCSCGLVEL